MITNITDFPKEILWMIFKHIGRKDIFNSKIEDVCRKFKNIIQSTDFRTFLMNQFRTSNEVYNIDIAENHLRPQNTMRIRVFDDDNCNYFDTPYTRNPRTYNFINGLFDYRHGFSKEHLKWLNEHEQYRNKQYNDIIEFSYDYPTCETYDQFVTASNDGPRIYTTPIEKHDVHVKLNPFQHKWNKHNLVGIDHMFVVSDNMKNIKISLDSNGKPIQFPKPEKILPNHNLDEELKRCWGQNLDDFKPLSTKELCDKNILYINS
jgi:hypothetical protein